MERRRKPDWSPTVGIATAARFYFLDAYCPGCRQVKQVDLRKLDRHAFGLIPSLSCRSCRPSPPFARILRLTEHEWESGNRPAYMPKTGI